jgi:hypothetical protein
MFNTIFNWPWSYGSWINNYICNQCLSPRTLWVRTPLMWGVPDTTLCDQVCQCLAAGWFSSDTPVSSTIKTDRHDITEILLTMVLNTITLTPQLRKESLISDGHQFHQYQQNVTITSHLNSLNTKKTTTCDIGNPGPGLKQCLYYTEAISFIDAVNNHWPCYCTVYTFLYLLMQ